MMTRDQIIELAKKCGLKTEPTGPLEERHLETVTAPIERFATELLRIGENRGLERAALICDASRTAYDFEVAFGPRHLRKRTEGMAAGAGYCAIHIRAMRTDAK